MGALRRIPASSIMRQGQFWLLRVSQHAKNSACKMAVFWLLEEFFMAG
jgi:hypothetical protein